MLYFLQIRDPVGVVLEDEQGTEFSTLDEAIEDAKLLVGEIAGDWIRSGRPVPYSGFQVTDQNGSVCAAMTIDEAISRH